MPFTQAVRERVLARVALIGPSGAGKTKGALDIATAIVDKWGGRIAGIDSEHGRMKLYADRYDFDHLDLIDTSPEGYRAALDEAVAGRYRVAVIDSTSQEWFAILGDADRFGDWKTVRPRHNDWARELVDCPLHVIVTMRAKTKYSVEEVDDGNRKRQVITRLGVGPVQSEGIEYDFDIFGHLDASHEATWYNRCDPLVGTASTPENAAPVIVEWLEKGDPVPWRPPANIADALVRISSFVESPRPWLEEAFVAHNADAESLPAKIGDLAPAVRQDTLERLAEVVRILDEDEAATAPVGYSGGDEKVDKKVQALVRRAFSAAFDADVAGPDPFAGPIPFG